MKPPYATAGLLAFALVSASPIAAEEIPPGQSPASQGQTGQKAPEEVIDEITSKENLETGPSGNSVPSTGEAEPVENWFGCPPKEGEEANASAERAETQTAEKRESCLDKDADAESLKTPELTTQ